MLFLLYSFDFHVIQHFFLGNKTIKLPNPNSTNFYGSNQIFVKVCKKLTYLAKL